MWFGPVLVDGGVREHNIIKWKDWIGRTELIIKVY